MINENIALAKSILRKQSIAVNSEPNNFIFPTADTSLNLYWNSKEFKNKPIFYLIDKSTMKSDLQTDDLEQVIQSIKNVRRHISIEKQPVEKSPIKKVSKFWDFIKKRPLL